MQLGVQWEWRPAGPADDAFLERLFRSTRPDLELLPAALAGQMVAMQRQAQEQACRYEWPGAITLVVEMDGAPAGRVVLADQSACVRVVDLAVLPAFRRRGCATGVLRRIQHKAAERGCDVALCVAHYNAAARRLYLSLGFHEDGRDDFRASLRWRSE